MTRRPAFTLVEMIAASAALALLMGGAASVISMLARDQGRRTTGVNIERSSVQVEFAWVDRLKRDLRGARSIDLGAAPDRLVLRSYAAIDPKTLTLQCRPVELTYVIQRDESLALLVRQQRYLDDPLATGSFNELVAVGVSQLTLTAEVWDRAVQLGRPIPEPRELPIQLKLSWRHASDEQPKSQAMVLR